MDGRKIVTGALLGGVMIGTFLGMTTPTAMAYKAEDEWRAKLPETHVPTIAQPDQVAYNYGTPESVAPEFNIYHSIDAAERSRYLAAQREQDQHFDQLQAAAEAQVDRSLRESRQAEAAARQAEQARDDAVQQAAVEQPAAPPDQAEAPADTAQAATTA